MKSLPAPALERGICILKSLCSQPEQSLHDLAEKTAMPKSSILRVLATLIGCGLTERLPGGSYRAMVRLTPISDSRLDSRVQQSLETLAESAGQTAEWYVPSPEGMILSRRAEPHDAQVGVRARVGYVRPWTGELEAVCCIGRAYYSTAPRGKFWIYVKDGKGGKISSPRAAGLIRMAASKGFAADEKLNTNGVRRAACPILHNGSLAGVLAVAEYRQPGPDRLKEIVHLLLHAAGKLQSAG